MEVTVNSTCARRRRAEGGEVTYRAAAGVHLALRTDNAAGGGAGCESVAHIERREVLEEERDGALHLHVCEVGRVGRVVVAGAPVHRAPLPCAERAGGWGRLLHTAAARGSLRAARRLAGRCARLC